jgi:hypothetical protein
MSNSCPPSAVDASYTSDSTNDAGIPRDEASSRAAETAAGEKSTPLTTAPRPGQRVQSDMALQMHKPKPGDIPDFRNLERIQGVPARTEPADVVERASWPRSGSSAPTWCYELTALAASTTIRFSGRCSPAFAMRRRTQPLAAKSANSSAAPMPRRCGNG